MQAKRTPVVIRAGFAPGYYVMTDTPGGTAWECRAAGPFAEPGEAERACSALAHPNGCYVVVERERS